MLEKWKRVVHNGKTFGLLLTDLSKAFDCLSRELLLAKLRAYGFSFAALRLIHSYLTNRKQRTKVNSSSSLWEEILFGVPQRSIEFNNLAADVFNATLAQANLTTKTDFDVKLSSLNRKIAANKSKHLLVENELKKLKTFDLGYFRAKSHFEEDGMQNTARLKN